MIEYEFRQEAGIFPLIEGEEFKAFRDDIARNGLLDPIELHPDGRIIDGRNRYRACRDLGMEGVFIPWTGEVGQEVAYVIAKNVARRHQDESGRAMSADRLANLQNGSNRHKKQSISEDYSEAGLGRPIGGSKPASEDTGLTTCFHNTINRQDAAAIFKVSERSIQRARIVHESGTPELVKAVEQGKITVSLGAALTKESEEFRYRRRWLWCRRESVNFEDVTDQWGFGVEQTVNVDGLLN